MTRSDDHEDLLTTSQFAKRVGCTPETIRRHVRSGKFKEWGRTPTDHYRFHPSQVDEFINRDRRTVRQDDMEAHVLMSMQRMRLKRRRA